MNSEISTISCDTYTDSYGASGAFGENDASLTMSGHGNVGLTMPRYTGRTHIGRSTFDVNNDTIERGGNIDIQMLENTYFSPQVGPQWAIKPGCLSSFSTVWSWVVILPSGNTKEGTEAEEKLAEYMLQSDLLVLEKEEYKKDVALAIEMAFQSFRTVNNLKVKIENDPEIPEMRTIRLILEVSDSPENVLNEEISFKKHLRSRLSDEVRNQITISYDWIK